jgi:hypothetical protein
LSGRIVEISGCMHGAFETCAAASRAPIWS